MGQMRWERVGGGSLAYHTENWMLVGRYPIPVLLAVLADGWVDRGDRQPRHRVKTQDVMVVAKQE